MSPILTPEERVRFCEWCEAEAAKHRAFSDASGRLGTQVGDFVGQGEGLAAASLQVVSVLLGGDPVPAPPEPPADQPKPPELPANASAPAIGPGNASQ